MGVKAIRILLLADTHLGIDFAFRPRIQRRRRGDDFFANYHAALKPALEGRVDLVVHGGDLLYRSKVPGKLVKLALDPLIEVADRGVPVCLVPGNHERSKIPYPILARHAGLFVFDRPTTFQMEISGLRLAVAGFPFLRSGIRAVFSRRVSQTGLLDIDADIRILCLHEAVEGARVGNHDYTFRNTPDVVRGLEIPSQTAAVLCGHIHRHQVLTRDLSGKELGAPVLYPGSIERTSFAEAREQKGYLIVEVIPEVGSGGRLAGFEFVQLPARPMQDISLEVGNLGPAALTSRIQGLLDGLDPDSIVRLRPQGRLSPEAAQVLGAQSLRALAPASMNVSVAGSWWSQRTNQQITG
jgi:DNA repair exonuclease SbcCD nuclease subunit